MTRRYVPGSSGRCPKCKSDCIECMDTADKCNAGEEWNRIDQTIYYQCEDCGCEFEEIRELWNVYVRTEYDD